VSEQEIKKFFPANWYAFGNKNALFEAFAKIF